MDLTHHFTVPTSVEETWSHFQDIASVGGCFPGATVTSVDGDTFQGTVKVKLGPIALVYSGTGTFVDKDEDAHSFKVDAKGKDKRGNGTAGAKVTLSMIEGSEGGTDVEVITDLAVTGKPAQFGRGVMQDVSDKLLGQFVACLEQKLGESSASSAEAPVEPTADPAATAEATVVAGPQSVAAPAEPSPADAATPDAAPAPAAAGAGTVGMAAAQGTDAGRHAAPATRGAAHTGSPSGQRRRRRDRPRCDRAADPDQVLLEAGGDRRGDGAGDRLADQTLNGLGHPGRRPAAAATGASGSVLRIVDGPDHEGVCRIPWRRARHPGHALTALPTLRVRPTFVRTYASSADAGIRQRLRDMP